MKGRRTKNDCYKWIPEEQADMLDRMLKHQKGQKASHTQEVTRGSQRGSPLEINKIQKNLSENPGEETSCIPTEEMVSDKYAELMDFKKFEKIKDKLDISLRKRL
jgi:hypothetical protein